MSSQCASGWLHRWNEEFELLVHDPEHETVTCVLMNRSNVGADEEIGRVEVRHSLIHQQAILLSACLGLLPFSKLSVPALRSKGEHRIRSHTCPQPHLHKWLTVERKPFRCRIHCPVITLGNLMHLTLMNVAGISQRAAICRHKRLVASRRSTKGQAGEQSPVGGH